MDNNPNKLIYSPRARWFESKRQLTKSFKIIANIETHGASQHQNVDCVRGGGGG